MIERANVPALDPRRYGFNLDASLIRSDFVSEVLPEVVENQDTFDTTGILDFPAGSGTSFRTIHEISERLASVYCEGIGYEFFHLPSKHERRFLERLLESSHAIPISKAQALSQWKLLADSENFDRWAAKKFPNVKRYGLEGAEGMMVALGSVFAEAEKIGAEDVVL